MMKKKWEITLLSLAVLFFCSSCASVNEGLDGANKGARQVGKPVGKALHIPGSIHEGAAEGIVTEENEDNPMNR
jgi:hypothetical protein